jgi:hypothetical protein
MKYFRNIALVASLAAGLALPAMAQTASPETAAPQAATPAETPAAPQSAAMPDTGVKKAAPSGVKHTHHASHKAKAKPGPAKKLGAK